MRPIQFIQDGYGAFSATRLAFLLWVVGVLAVWIYLSIVRAESLLHIDSSVVTLIGILMTGKVVQSFSPNDGPAAANQAKVSATATAPVSGDNTPVPTAQQSP